METKKGYFLSPIVNLLLFDALLVATPFLMLQNYLQQFVKELSGFSIDIFEMQLPIILTLFFFFTICLIIIFCKKITIKLIIVFLIVLLMMVVGQKTADYYINYKFYDLQNNWHYFAYGIFVFVMYRYLITKNISDEKVIIITFFKALLISAFDEGIQVFISNRIFDISDIAKDMWGVVMGLMILIFIYRDYSISPKKWKLRFKSFKDYLKNPYSVLIYLVLIAYIFLFFSSILTDANLWYMILLCTCFGFYILFFTIHFTQFRLLKNSVIFFYFVVLLILVMQFFFHDSKEIIISKDSYLTTYKGIPIVYFDFIVYPDGYLRLVDKKTYFKGGDFLTFFNQGADILIIASGKKGDGGKGFKGGRFSEFPYFIFNTLSLRPMQVVILKNAQAFEEYNRLIRLKKKVLLVVHNT